MAQLFFSYQTVGLSELTAVRPQAVIHRPTRTGCVVKVWCPLPSEISTCRLTCEAAPWMTASLLFLWQPWVRLVPRLHHHQTQDSIHSRGIQWCTRLQDMGTLDLHRPLPVIRRNSYTNSLEHPLYIFKMLSHSTSSDVGSFTVCIIIVFEMAFIYLCIYLLS